MLFLRTYFWTPGDFLGLPLGQNGNKPDFTPMQNCPHNVINRPSLLPMVVASSLVSDSTPRLWHTSILSCTSAGRQSSTEQPMYTCVSLPCSEEAIVPTLFSVCSSVRNWPYSSTQTDSHSLSSLMNSNVALEESLHVLLTYHLFLTAPDLALVLKGKRFSQLASILHLFQTNLYTEYLLNAYSANGKKQVIANLR